MKKLHFYFLFMAALSLAFVSCDNDEEDGKLKITRNGEEMTSVSIASFETTTILAQANVDGEYFAKSDNEDIATVKAYRDCIVEGFENNDILFEITGHQKGSTIITLTDSKNRTARFEVIVNNKEVTFTVAEHFTLIETEEEAEENQTAIDKIKKEIVDKLVPIKSSFAMTYTSEDKGNLIYYPDFENVEENSEGNFEIIAEKSGRYFIFNYNEQEYKYRLEFGANRQKTSVAPNYVYLVLDFTDDYKDILQPKITKAEGVLTVMIN
ncbi:hypothetical protein [Dysgonomonas sp. Marseille-P4361]|uniref:hypothetical protein n=1 Tax=Dysgonomonas sp. Marseille-P4361 TaxID=2161820 RepID=UPI000D553017|nr:hypothetical protein [Dysgonomonas sp. Marseille-P4361]